MSNKRFNAGIMSAFGIIASAMIVLTACGADDGGQADPNEHKDVSYSDGIEGSDKQVIETYDQNVEVQKVTVDGIDCVIAVRDDISVLSISCVR